MSFFSTTEQHSSHRVPDHSIAMTSTTTKSKIKASEIGAPAQFKQATRKGKKAWRKNIDIQPEETAMEDARAEERLTG